MKIFTLLFLLLFILLSVFLMDAANAQLNTENLFKAPFIYVVPEGMDFQNSQQNMLGIHSDAKSLIQNSEKDIVFIENLGQIRDSKGNKIPDVLYLTRSQGVDVYITSSGITFVFRKTEGDARESSAIQKGKETRTSLYRLDTEFVGMNKNFTVKKELSVEQKFNYYTPEYPDGLSPRGYKKITIENIYDGIDLVYYEKEGKMKYDFVVRAGADASKIKMKYIGAGSLYIDKDGSIVITTPMGEIREEKPYTYFKKTGTKIDSRYKVKNKLVQFYIVEYDKGKDIIIDPYRIWATFYGGNNDDVGYGICTDNSGNLYITGTTGSIIFPTQILSGAYNQTTYSGGEDVYILKFNSNGVRTWATYYGGSYNDNGYSICTDNSGNLYITGTTRSANFPIQILPGAYNQTSGRGVFLLKFNSSGARLWATYYGGNINDQGYGICTDNAGNLHVTGVTQSTSFPTQTFQGAYNQITYGGGDCDAFILKFNSSCARTWATYYGGSTYDCGYDICTDNSNNLYVTGKTFGYFPTQTLSGAYNQTYADSCDAFILKFNSYGVRLWASYYGGDDYDCGEEICIDNLGNLYVTGATYSIDFPSQILPGAYNDSTLGGGFGDVDAFILKFNSSSARLWATYYGGDSSEYGYSICTDNLDALYITGSTESTNFPTQTLTGTYNQTIHGGGVEDAFILNFNSNGVRIWATYYGGQNYDCGNSICTDNSNNLYVTGKTRSTNFPALALAGAYNQAAYGGGDYDAFILKFNTSVGIKKISNEIPSKHSLQQNYPNPFNPVTNIKFDIPKPYFVKLIVYNVLGKEVSILVNEKLNAGRYKVDWNGRGYASGVYFYKLITDEYVNVKKMLLVK